MASEYVICRSSNRCRNLKQNQDFGIRPNNNIFGNILLFEISNFDFEDDNHDFFFNLSMFPEPDMRRGEKYA